jgi:hypothetical protein
MFDFFRCKHPFSSLLAEQPPVITERKTYFTEYTQRLRCLRCDANLRLTWAIGNDGRLVFSTRSGPR